jgi:hypothetical protein
LRLPVAAPGAGWRGSHASAACFALFCGPCRWEGAPRARAAPTSSPNTSFFFQSPERELTCWRRRRTATPAPGGTVFFRPATDRATRWGVPSWRNRRAYGFSRSCSRGDDECCVGRLAPGELQGRRRRARAASLSEAALGELVAAWDRGQAANDTAMGRFLTWVCPTAGGGAQDAGKALRSRKRAKSTAKTANRAPTPYASRPTAAVRKTTGLKRRAEQANKELRRCVGSSGSSSPPAESAEVSSLATVADARLG